VTTTGSWLVLFVAGVAVSLAASWLLVSRLERLAERAGFSEAWLGLVAALAADAPEITSAVTALARGQSSVGAGVVVGSNVFNLAALLGLAAVVAGRVRFHRRVVLLGGLPGIWVAAVCLLTVAEVVPPAAGLALAAVVLGSWRRMRRCSGCVVPGWSACGSPVRGPGGWSRRCMRRKMSWPRRSGPVRAPGATAWPPPRLWVRWSGRAPRWNWRPLPWVASTGWRTS
jgi:hypothetical protein